MNAAIQLLNTDLWNTVLVCLAAVAFGFLIGYAVGFYLGIGYLGEADWDAEPSDLASKDSE